MASYYHGHCAYCRPDKGYPVNHAACMGGVCVCNCRKDKP